jgi:TonB family protein
VSDRFSRPARSIHGLSRTAVITGSVVIFHVAALWALQSGLIRKAVDVVIPVTIMSEFIEPPKPKAPPSVQLPSSNADYLNNPKPVYPAMSKRLGEQGKTILRVLIGADGLPRSATVRQSSGYERLDEAARVAVMSWRYVPGKRNGVVEAMEFNVPINWVLN